MSEKEKINSEGLKNVSGGSNVGVPNPYPFKCPKCGKSFDMTEIRVGCGEYCKECQEKYPEELPINDPKSPLGRLFNNRKLNETESEKVAGGYEYYGDADWSRMEAEARKRGTCKECGKKFEEAKHKKVPNAVYPMNIIAQQWCEINWCGDCMYKYLGKPLFYKH